MNIKSFRKDVRGAALVYVIVAAAILVLLGAATTATAYANLRATQIQEKSDNNFYNADSVMNAIVSGLESDVSRAYELAYTRVTTNINNYENEEQMFEDFETQFKNELNSILNDGAESFEFFYNAKHIQGYVQAVFEDDIKYTVSALNGNNYLDDTEDGIILRNLHVTYEDDSGYFDEITTDIKIATPTIDIYWEPDPDRYPMDGVVIDDGLEINANRGLQINGNSYINERESDKSAILLNNHTALTIATPEILIAGGFIETKEDTRLTLSGSTDATAENEIWTENFDLGRYTIAEIIGLINVHDDLEVNGSYSKVRVAGQYYGYSRSNTSVDDSSAININGAHTTLDLTGLTDLVIAGSSYVSTSEVEELDNRYENTVDIQLGEALSVKSNQIAYLVDDKEFLAWKDPDDNDGVPLRIEEIPGFVSNPMSYNQYTNLCAWNTNWESAKSKMLSKKLSYGKSYFEYGADITPVFSSKDGGTVYLYLNFSDTDKAAAYFVDVYRGNTLMSQRLRTYAAQYITSLKFNPDTNLLINQNYFNKNIAALLYEYSNENLPLIEDGFGYNKDPLESAPNHGDGEIQNRFDNFIAGLTEDYWGDPDVADDGIKYSVMYNRMINEDKLREFIQGATSANASIHHNTNNNITVVENGVIMNGTSGAQAILIDNAGKEPYELGDGAGIVIVTGDLHITGDWLGSIIVGGRAYCTEGTPDIPVTVTTDAETVALVTPLYFSTTIGGVNKSMMVINVFIGYEDKVVNEATNDEGINADMISNCLSFTNWNRD